MNLQGLDEIMETQQYGNKTVVLAALKGT